MFSLHLHDLHQGNPRPYRGMEFSSAGSGDAGQSPCGRIGFDLRGMWVDAVRAS
jgi:hypothetical protein